MTRLEKLHGDSLEDALDFTHTLYFVRRKVWVKHNGIAGKWRNRSGRAVFTPLSRQAVPDYYGCVRGTFVAFDAKSEQDDRWRLPKDREHQWEILKDLATAGAVCWFAVEHRPQQTMHLLRILPDSPYPALRFDEPTSLYHLTIGWSGIFGAYDWLTAVEAAWL